MEHQTKIYECCKQLAGDGNNEITVLESGTDKKQMYDKVRDLRREQSKKFIPDNYIYWMRVKMQTEGNQL